MVDYNVSSVMLPSIVVGVLAGGIVNKLFPPLYLTIGLVILLLFLTVVTSMKLLDI